MKKFITILIIVALAAALAVSLVACDDNDSKGSPGKFPSGSGIFGELNTPEEVYGFSAASAGMLISAMNDGGTAAAAADVPATDPSAPDTGAGDIPSEDAAPVVDETTAMLDGYMALVESLLADGGFSMTTETSDLDDYAVKAVVSYRDINGKTTSYTMYYNEELIPDYDDDDDDDPFEVEEGYFIGGIMIIDGERYPIRGERSSESEPGESEEETEFVVTLPGNRKMVVEQSVENEDGEHEREYSYSVYEGRTLIESSTFEYESERGETEIEMTYFSAAGNVRQFFTFDRETLRGGREVVRVRVGSGMTVETYYVTAVEDAEGNVSYEYTKAYR